MQPKNTIESLPLQGKRVLVRADLNVPLKDKTITDDTRIRESLKTVEYLLSKQCTVILCSHLGRPDGQKNPKFSLEPVAKHLETLLKKTVAFASDCIGETAQKTIEANQGKVILLENLRFYAGEEGNDPDFAKELCRHADFFINDAFGTAHRAHASTYTAATLLPSAPGFLLQKEIEYLGGILHNPKRPLITVLGGSKVSTKLSVLNSLLKVSDRVLVGGGMIFTFFKAQGFEIGKSLCEDGFVAQARDLITQYGPKLVLPTDIRIAAKVEENQNTTITSIDQIPADKLGVDIGPETEKLFQAHLQNARTVLWNGPMGIFEIEAFASGTRSICQTLASLKNCDTVVGGGDSVAAVSQMGFQKSMTHISTGGGASLELLEGRELPGVKALL